MKDFKKLKVQELTTKEMRKMQGGFFRVVGWFDGEKGSRGYLFGRQIWNTY